MVDKRLGHIGREVAQARDLRIPGLDPRGERVVLLLVTGEGAISAVGSLLAVRVDDPRLCKGEGVAVAFLGGAFLGGLPLGGGAFLGFALKGGALLFDPGLYITCGLSEFGEVFGVAVVCAISVLGRRLVEYALCLGAVGGAGGLVNTFGLAGGRVALGEKHIPNVTTRLAPQ